MIPFFAIYLEDTVLGPGVRNCAGRNGTGNPPDIRAMRIPIPALFALAVLSVNSLAGAETPAWLRPEPKLKWLYLSTGVYFDRWGGSGETGNGPGWIAKNRALNPPQNLYGATLGASGSVTRNVSLGLALPFFYNTFEPYVDRSGGEHTRKHRSGIGDLDVNLPIRIGKLALQPQLSIPGNYSREYLVPWTGFGVYRGSLSGSYPLKAHSLWAGYERVLHKPKGDDSGLVEPGDYSLKGGYSWKTKLAPRFNGKAGFDMAYTSFTWQPTASAQRNFSLDPRIAVAFVPRGGRELALSFSATLYSSQGGEPDFRSYASRRVFAGLYYGLYF